MSSPVSVEESLTSQIRMTSSKGYALRPFIVRGTHWGPHSKSVCATNTSLSRALAAKDPKGRPCLGGSRSAVANRNPHDTPRLSTLNETRRSDVRLVQRVQMRRAAHAKRACATESISDHVGIAWCLARLERTSSMKTSIRYVLSYFVDRTDGMTETARGNSMRLRDLVSTAAMSCIISTIGCSPAA